jgi:hypothetical protein
MRATDVDDVAWPQQPVQIGLLTPAIRDLHSATLKVRVATRGGADGVDFGLVEDDFQDFSISGNAYKFTHNYPLR